MTTPDLNPITGLPDGYNEALGIPIINHRNIGRLRLSRQRVAENHIQMGRRRVLAFASKLQRSEVLVVTFHGANMRNKEIIYPRAMSGLPRSAACRHP